MPEEAVFGGSAELADPLLGGSASVPPVLHGGADEGLAPSIPNTPALTLGMHRSATGPDRVLTRRDMSSAVNAETHEAAIARQNGFTLAQP